MRQELRRCLSVRSKIERHLRAAVLAVFLTGLFCFVVPAQLSARAGVNLCQTAAEFASKETGVPVSVLLAVSLSETGRTVGDAFVPWPWTLNLAGKGHWLADQKTALAMARQSRKNGHQNFDVGCFQVNYRWHGDAFPNLQAMMDPKSNALYAARFLARLYKETADWPKAAGFYHSRTPHHANRYRSIFERHYAALTAGPTPRFSQRTPAVNKFPLLKAGGRGQGGSLVPLETGQARRVLAPAAPQPFWTGS